MVKSLGAGRPVLALVGAEVQARLQWWIACDPASLRASVSLQHGVGRLYASTLHEEGCLGGWALATTDARAFGPCVWGGVPVGVPRAGVAQGVGGRTAPLW